MDEIDVTLVRRQKTHGRYDNTAAAYSSIKEAFAFNWIPDEVLECAPNYRHPSDEIGGSYNSTRELALDNIAMKLARILSGDSRCIDHWRDIAGYATLQAHQLEADTGNPHSPNYAYQKEDGDEGES